MYQAGDLVEFHEGTVVCLLRPTGFEYAAWHVIVTVDGGTYRKGSNLTFSVPLLRCGSIVHSEVPTVKRVVRAIHETLPDYVENIEHALWLKADTAALDLFREGNPNEQEED